jgi:hypothetical protein
MDAVKILIINTDETPIQIEKYEFTSKDKDQIKETILSSLNRLGKTAYGLIKYKDEYWAIDHTAQGESISLNYDRHKVTYIPDELLKEFA